MHVQVAQKMLSLFYRGRPASKRYRSIAQAEIAFERQSAHTYEVQMLMETKFVFFILFVLTVFMVFAVQFLVHGF